VSHSVTLNSSIQFLHFTHFWLVYSSSSCCVPSPVHPFYLRYWTVSIYNVYEKKYANVSLPFPKSWERTCDVVVVAVLCWEQLKALNFIDLNLHHFMYVHILVNDNAVIVVLCGSPLKYYLHTFTHLSAHTYMLTKLLQNKTKKIILVLKKIKFCVMPLYTISLIMCSTKVCEHV
jgi:hypothetical protein